MRERVQVEVVSALDRKIVLVLQGREAFLEQSVCGLLQLGIQGRVYSQASGVEHLGPVVGYDLSADVLDEMGTGRRVGVALQYTQRRCVGHGSLVGRDGAVVHHHREDEAPAELGPLRMSPGGVATRVLGKPGYERGLCQPEL